MADALAPAIGYARDGFAVSRELELLLRGTQGMFTKYTGLAAALYVNGAPPRMGQVLRQPALADTLGAVARGGRGALYEGPIARRIAEGVQAAGGLITTEDLATHAADVLEPLSVDYRGYTVYETPPNSQGLILLEELNIIEGYDVAGWGHLSADAIHHMVEAKKLAFEDRHRFACDPSFADFDPTRLLGKEHAAARRGQIDPSQARAAAIPAASSDTTSFVVADGDGNYCSFIQSLFAPFGSAICLPELGIIMNNRMCGFSLDPAHPNVLAPGKRTMHTLNTYMVFRDGKPYLIGNTPGADYQVQTNLQVITGVLDFALDPQAAVDAPRWGDTPAGLLVEEDMPDEAVRELSRRGHTLVTVPKRTNGMGRAQAIVLDAESGAFVGGSDSRGEGGAAGW
jgi:gamma-glutamyltranspeptidase/glutathione hydrolase